MNGKKLEILDFYADWCGPCKIMQPMMEEFEKAHPEIGVKRVNIDEDEELAEKYGVSGIPCLVVLEDGEEIKRAVGMQSAKKLEKLVAK